MAFWGCRACDTGRGSLADLGAWLLAPWYSFSGLALGPRQAACSRHVLAVEFMPTYLPALHTGPPQPHCTGNPHTLIPTHALHAGRSHSYSLSSPGHQGGPLPASTLGVPWLQGCLLLLGSCMHRSAPWSACSLLFRTPHAREFLQPGTHPLFAGSLWFSCHHPSWHGTEAEPSVDTSPSTLPSLKGGIC